mgnify:CR=1 FL=1
MKKEIRDSHGARARARERERERERREEKEEREREKRERDDFWFRSGARERVQVKKCFLFFPFVLTVVSPSLSL